ncbi:MAG: OmpA family protein [Campylobacterota bacterium]|nr:OmpA family protein [Campylobacterota bacterium]
MKNIILSSATVALLVFSGCADKKPIVDEKVNQVNVEEVSAIQSEIISSENSSISGYNSGYNSGSVNGSKSMLDVEEELTSIYFDFDKFLIRSDMQSRVSEDATIAKNQASNYTVKLEGNCDEWGSDEYNFALGLKRAQTVKNAMIAEGVESKKITMVSYGESNPVCTDKTKECWAKSRRVDFKILP